MKPKTPSKCAHGETVVAFDGVLYADEVPIEQLDAGG